MTVLTDPTGHSVDVPEQVAGDYIAQGYTRLDSSLTVAQVPDDTWTIRQLDAYAATHGIDMSGASKKADKLARVTTPDTE